MVALAKLLFLVAGILYVLTLILWFIGRDK
jgi:hypothetical protein